MMWMQHVMKNASPQKRRAVALIYLGLLVIGASLFVAYAL